MAKRSLKKWYSVPSISFAIISTHLLLCRRTLLELNSLESYPSSEGKRNPRRGLFTSSIKGEMRHFHVVFVHWRQSNLHWKKVWCTCKVVVLLIKPIDRFQSRGQQLCKLLGIKESFNMWKEFNSHRIFFLHTNKAADPLFCTQIWPPWRHVKTIYCFCWRSRCRRRGGILRSIPMS